MTNERADTPKCVEFFDCAEHPRDPRHVCGHDLPCPIHPAVDAAETPTDDVERCPRCLVDYVNDVDACPRCGKRMCTRCVRNHTAPECPAPAATVEPLSDACVQAMDGWCATHKRRLIECGVMMRNRIAELERENVDLGDDNGSLREAVRSRDERIRTLEQRLSDAERDVAEYKRAYDVMHKQKIAALQRELESWLESERDCRTYELRLIERMIAEPHKLQAIYPGKFYQYVVAALDRLDSLQSENAKLRERWGRQTAFMERNIGDLVYCEYCGIAMLSGEDGCEVFQNANDESDTFEVCDNCAAAATKEKGRCV